MNVEDGGFVRMPGGHNAFADGKRRNAAALEFFDERWRRRFRE